MRRRALILVLLSALIFTAYRIAWPRILQCVLIHQLRKVGFDHATLTVSEATLNNTLITDLSVSNSFVRLRLERVAASYTVADILAGRIAALSMDGIRADLRTPCPPMKMVGTPPPPATLLNHIVITNARIRIAAPDATHVVAIKHGAVRLAEQDFFDLQMQAEVTTQTASNKIALACRELSFRGHAALNAGVPACRGVLRVADGTVSARSPQFTAMGIDATIPLNDRPLTDAPPSGHFYAGMIQGFGRDFTCPTTRVEVVENTLHLSGPIPLPRAVAVSGRAWAKHVRLPLTPGGIPEAMIVLDALCLTDPTWDVEAEITTTFTISPQGKWLTPDEQTIKAGFVRCGEMKLTEASARFRIATNGFVEVTAPSFSWAGGRVSSPGFALDPDGRRFDLRLEFEELQLAEMLALAAAGRASGEGSLSGFWNLAFVRKPAPHISFGEGLLTTDSGKGWFKIDEPADIDALLGQRAPQDISSWDRDIIQKIKRALYDFEFDTLSVEFSEHGNDLFTQVKAAGRGPRGDAPVPFGGLTLNITGLDDLLSLLILRSNDTKRQLEDAVRQALGDILKAPDTPAAAETAAEERAIDAFF